MKNDDENTHAGSDCQKRLVRLFLSGQSVSRYCGTGDRSEMMNWLHVTWITADIKSDRAATWWGFGSAFINDRIVFEILRHPEQWEIILPNETSPSVGATEKDNDTQDSIRALRSNGVQYIALRWHAAAETYVQLEAHE